MDNKSVYEKEIYSDVIPLSKREIEAVIKKYCQISNYEPQKIIPSYDIIKKGSKLLVFYQTELRVIDFPESNPFYYLSHKRPDNQIKIPDYLGYVEMREIKPPIEIPIQIRIVSYHAEVDLWWERLTQEVITKLHEEIPSFIPRFDANIPSINSEKKPIDLDVIPPLNDVDPDSTIGRYGTYRDITLVEVKAVVASCKAFQEREGTISIYYHEVLDDFMRTKFRLETLKSWLKNEKFKP